MKIRDKIKKIREKLSRKQAELYQLIKENVPKDLDDKPQKNQAKQHLAQSVIEELQQEEQILLEQRKKEPSTIKIKDMEESIKYNQLDGEGKHFQNIIKMICYRSETAFANLLTPHYKKSTDEIRGLVKKIINTTIDLKSDLENNQLVVTLYTLPTKRDNDVLNKILETLNDSQIQFPGTNIDPFLQK